MTGLVSGLEPSAPWEVTATATHLWYVVNGNAERVDELQVGERGEGDLRSGTVALPKLPGERSKIGWGRRTARPSGKLCSVMTRNMSMDSRVSSADLALALRSLLHI